MVRTSVPGAAGLVAENPFFPKTWLKGTPCSDVPHLDALSHLSIAASRGVAGLWSLLPERSTSPEVCVWQTPGSCSCWSRNLMVSSVSSKPLQPGRDKARCQVIRCQVRALCRWPLRVLAWQRQVESKEAGSVLVRSLKSPPKAPAPNSFAQGLGFQHRHGGAQILSP